VEHTNLSAAHRAIAGRSGDRPALRFKSEGILRELTWLDYRRQVDEAAAGLIALGIGPADAVAILSENRPEWLIADLAILAAGAVNVPLHAPLSSEQVAYQLSHSQSKAVLVSSQAQADKVLAVLGSLPDLALMITLDPVDVDDRIARVSWEDLRSRGATDPTAMAEVLRRESKLGPEDLATIIYTSGTTGQPKGVMLSHGNLLSNAEAIREAVGTNEADLILSWLPFSHIYARTCDHYGSAVAGSTIFLASSMESIVSEFVEVGASRMNAVPRFYEKLWSYVEQLKPEDRSRRLLAMFGPTVRMLYSGGAPLPRHVAEGFVEAGLPLLEGYGLTEASPVITFNPPGELRVGTVGRPLPGVEVRIAPDGEVLTRGPNVMLGYWKDEEATRSAIVDGWLHTGDVGSIDDGFLTITDRKKDLIITSGGKNIAPSMLERLLVSDPYIDQAVVHGDRKPFVSALIVPNFPALQARAETLGCPVAIGDELIDAEPIRSFFAERIDRMMQAVSQPERVRAFLLLGRPLRVEDGEMTASLKVRRRHILGLYEDQLEALYTRPVEAPEDQGAPSR
jgi:long-chain acyl-CoA synthetase